MKYLESITDFFKSPKWTMNLLLGGVCCLIPIIGPMVYVGWLITGFWCREDQRPETFPDFDFNQFSKNLQRGLWPMLVEFVLGIVVVPILMVVFFVLLLMTGGLSHHGGGLFASFGMLVGMCFTAVFLAAISVIGVPLYLRAARLQDFALAFNIAYIQRFAMAMWKDILLVFLFGFAVLIPLWILLMIPCLGFLVVLTVGVALILHMKFHLINQLYNLYISRGGEPIPLSPKLTIGGVPPTLG